MYSLSILKDRTVATEEELEETWEECNKLRLELRDSCGSRVLRVYVDAPRKLGSSEVSIYIERTNDMDKVEATERITAYFFDDEVRDL